MKDHVLCCQNDNVQQGLKSNYNVNSVDSDGVHDLDMIGVKVRKQFSTGWFDGEVISVTGPDLYKAGQGRGWWQGGPQQNWVTWTWTRSWTTLLVFLNVMIIKHHLFNSFVYY